MLLRRLHRATSSLKLGNRSCFCSQALSSLPLSYEATASNSYSQLEDHSNINWDKLGFSLVPTDYMYVMKCSRGEEFSQGELNHYGNIELSPSSGILNYGQGLLEGLKAYRKEDDRLLLFRPEENALRMKMGAERLCMPSPSVQQFVDAVKQTVLANRRWVPPPGKGSLYIRPLLIGSGPILGLAAAPEYTFLIYASPVGNYFKEGLSPITLLVEEKFHRATLGGTGAVKTVSNYAPFWDLFGQGGSHGGVRGSVCLVLKAQTSAKARGFSDILFLDSVNNRYLEEVSSCNIFIVKDRIISTPALCGTILSGITRKSIIGVARDHGYQVEERLVSVEDLIAADEVFCTGTAVVLSPVGSIMYRGKRVEYQSGGVGKVSRQLYSTLQSIQMGLAEDKMGWTVELD